MLLFKRFTLAFFAFFFILVFQASAQTSAFSPEQKGLLKAALRTAVVQEKSLEDYAKLPDPEKIVLLDKMVSLTRPNDPPVFLTEAVLPEFKDVKFKLKTEEAIRKKNSRKDLWYLRVITIDQPEGDYGIVSVVAQNKLGKNSLKKGYKYRESRGYSMLFQKENGDWKFMKILASFPNLIDSGPAF